VMLQPVTYGRKEGKEDKEMAEYLAQLAKAAKVLARTQVTTSRQQRIMQCQAIPKGIDYPRLKFTLKPRTLFSGATLCAARVETDHPRCFWAPSKQTDGGDYLDVDMGKMVFVVAVGTKGRALLRDVNDEICSESPSEWVSRFKAFWKRDEHDVWKPLGDFAANCDTESEVANFVVNPHSEKPGLELRYLRIQPTSFHHRKSMRVGVYGRAIEVPIEESSAEQQTEFKPNLDEVTSRVVTTPSVLFQVQSTVTKEAAGKFNFGLDTLRGAGSRLIERRRLKRADRNKIRRFGREAAADSAGENLEASVFSSSTFPRSTISW